MLYNFKEYKPKFDTPMKRQQELAIARKIMDLLNKNKYDNLEEFITKNAKYQDFLKKQNMSNVIKHFGNTLKEEDYINILENLRTLTKEKQNFEKDNIKTTTIGNKQFNSLKTQNRTIFIDNSNTDKPIEQQMKDLQPTMQSLQTSDEKKNTENIFKELETKKEGLQLNYLHEVNYDILNNEEKELYNAANNHEQNVGTPLRIDVKKGIIVDEEDNIMKIEKKDGKYTITKNENGVQKEVNIEKNIQKQRILTPSNNSIYSN